MVYQIVASLLAYATSLAVGHTAGQYQQQMRQHLFHCIESREMSMFPFTRLRRASESTIKASERCEVHCLCRMPVLNRDEPDWIECSGCHKWFHLETCMQASNKQLETILSTLWMNYRMSHFLCCCSLSHSQMLTFKFKVVTCSSNPNLYKITDRNPHNTHLGTAHV